MRRAAPTDAARDAATDVARSRCAGLLPPGALPALALLTMLAACGDEPSAPTPNAGAALDGGRTGAEGVLPSRWTLLAPADDPWATHADPLAPCDPRGLKDEGDFFEIDTRVCGAATVQQPLGTDIHAGDRLEALVWHLDLVADSPATGHVVLTVGDEVLLEQDVPIPSAERLYDVRLVATFDAPAGAPVRFHVHNHGYNNWRLAYLRVLP
jgi:hypothetical protein